MQKRKIMLIAIGLLCLAGCNDCEQSKPSKGPPDAPSDLQQVSDTGSTMLYAAIAALSLGVLGFGTAKLARAKARN